MLFLFHFHVVCLAKTKQNFYSEDSAYLTNKINCNFYFPLQFLFDRSILKQ